MFKQSLKYAASIGLSSAATYSFMQNKNNNSTSMQSEQAIRQVVSDPHQVILAPNQQAHPDRPAHFTEIKKWDKNWDHRNPTPKNLNDENSNSDSNNDHEFMDIKLPGKKGYRNIFLIRHGQYFTKEKEASLKKLTPLGHEQARYTGIRLANMFNFDKEAKKRQAEAKNKKNGEGSGTDSGIESSTESEDSTFNYPTVNVYQSSMIRAIETSEEIKSILTEAKVDWQLKGQSDLLCEGPPYPAEPPISSWTEKPEYYEASARIEAAFRKFIHRGEPEQDFESNDVIVCHANVIRYFVCRALQIPPESWLRQSLAHGSITWIRVSPSGNVSLRCLGESGFVPMEKVSRR